MSADIQFILDSQNIRIQETKVVFVLVYGSTQFPYFLLLILGGKAHFSVSSAEESAKMHKANERIEIKHRNLLEFSLPLKLAQIL